MKKLFLLGAATAALLCAGPAMAGPTATSNISLTGDSPQVCTLSAVSAPSATGSLSTGALGGTTVTVSPIFDTTDSHIHAGTITLEWTGMCNYAHNVSIKSTSGAMINGAYVAPVGGTFVKRVGYAATFTWGPTSITPTAGITDLTSTTDQTAPGAQTSTGGAVIGADAGNLDVTLTFNDNASPVVSGTYTDTLTAQLGVHL
jgi:hypothetical protein